MIQSTAFVGFNKCMASALWGRVLLRSAVAIMPQVSARQTLEASVAAPNTYSDSGGSDPKRSGGCAQASVPRAGPDTHSFPRPRNFKWS